MSNTVSDNPSLDFKMDVDTSQESLGGSTDTDSKDNSLSGMGRNCLESEKTGNNITASECIARKSPSNSSYRSSTLTLVDSHPLMIAEPTDPDYEFDDNTNNQYNNYPDVIPQCTTHKLKTDELEQSSSNMVTDDQQNNISLAELPKRKIPLIETTNQSDFVKSSDSEPELSQYEATVTSSYQSVALVSNQMCKNQEPEYMDCLSRRKLSVSNELLTDDVSSVDSNFSNKSIDNDNMDEDFEAQMCSVSASSSILDDPLSGSTAKTPEIIPPYSASDEARDVRSWQKMTLPDGTIREIDMKVIEPYKRVLSHGGYLQSGGHNAIILFCACHLPDRSRKDYHYVMENLFLYVMKTLEQLVTEDYVLIYLHGGSCKSKLPTLPWLKKCYQLIDRRLRKSLKHLYIVHPTFWLKSIVWMSRPFISTKFWRKLLYVRSLEDLYGMIPVEKAAVPDKVKFYDSKYA